ncbi:MAG: ABC transporter permease [Lachnospiraceae bacterium]
MIDFLLSHPEKVITPLLEHISLTAITLAFSVLLASALTVLAVVMPVIGNMLTVVFSVVYSIPSLALFALMIPLTGLGRTTAVIVLCAYNQYLLLGNFLTGLNEVDPGVREAAKGIGMTTMQELFLVQIPLARKALFAGIRLAMVSTIGIGTIAAAINAGGLGTLLFDGLRTMNTAKILWGSLLSAVLAVSANGLLKLAEKGVRR